MEILLYRHGRTAGNLRRRYIGRTDEPLCPEGLAALRPEPFSPDTVFVSPMRRARETAAVLFPKAAQSAVDGLREMDFGEFENQNYEELAGNAAYAAWLDTNCAAPCPGGESLAAFCARVRDAFAALADEALRRGDERLVIVAHGGTIMAAASGFAAPHRDYFDWKTHCGACRRFRLEPEVWLAERAMTAL